MTTYKNSSKMMGLFLYVSATPKIDFVFQFSIVKKLLTNAGSIK